MSNQIYESRRKIRRILVGYDGSAEADEAVRLALDLASALDAEVTILGVLPVTQHLETDEDRSLSEHEARARFEREIAPFEKRASELAVKLLALAIADGGDPANVIAKRAEEHGFDLVVVGNHGQDQLFHGGLGKVVERLLKNPHYPVLVAPAFLGAS